MFSSENFKIILRFKCFQLCSFFWILKEYVYCPKFFIRDVSLLFLYVFSSPYRLCRYFWEQSESFSVPYGETPLRTWNKISREAGIGQEDTLLDLGSGRGRLLFWSLSRLGCCVLGIESVPIFVNRARFLVKFFSLENASFFLGDLCSAPFEKATIIYCYASLSDEELFCDLAIWLSGLSHRPLIITVGQKLAEHVPHFIIEKEIEEEFGWGKTSVYFQRYRDNF